MNKEELFSILYDKDTSEIYKKFQEIENSINNSNELYKYFYEIQNMLLNNKSSIRVRAFRLICKLSKWDCENKINNSIDFLLSELDDAKPTAIRQCLNSLGFLLLFKPELYNVIERKIKEIDLSKYKDSMSPLIKKDIQKLLLINNNFCIKD